MSLNIPDLLDREWQAFWLSIKSFTRLPTPHVAYSTVQMQRASSYLPWVGWLIGGICALAFLGLQSLWGTGLAVWATLALGIWVTGAFHEDGFADFCDGMGGGWTTDQVLRIMKDSYLGTFGVLGLITSFLLKGNALLLLDSSQIPLALVLMHSYPRFGAVLLQNISSYVQRDEHSKMRLLAAPHSPWRLLVAGLASVVLAALLVEGIFLLGFLVGGFVIVLLMRRYLNKRLGGYTGDCLGALEQILELFVVLWLALF